MDSGEYSAGQSLNIWVVDGKNNTQARNFVLTEAVNSQSFGLTFGLISAFLFYWTK